MNEKKIAELVIGEIVSVDDNLREVVSVRKLRHSDMVRVKFSDGDSLTHAPDYLLPTTNLRFR